MSESTITNAIDLGDFPDEMMEVLGRLEWLPEFGITERLKVVEKHCIEALDAARKAQELRRKARAEAHELMKAVQKHWTAKQIKQATGYLP